MSRYDNEENNKTVGLVSLAFGAFVFVCLMFASCERVDVGHVGIKVNKAGDSRGVQNVPTVSGYVFKVPFMSSVLEYPVFMQIAKWEGQEAITFNTNEGMAMDADVSISFQLTPEKVPAFYAKFRTDDIDQFTHGFLRNSTRDAFNDVAGGNYSAEQVLSQKKEELLTIVKRKLNDQLADIGVTVQQLGFLSAPRPPEVVKNAITAKITATQQAMQVENELRKTEAEAKKRVAEAEGNAAAKIALAEAEAKTKVALAEADAKANTVLTKSLTSELIQWQQMQIQREAVQKWNGQRPQVEGASSGLMLNVGGVK